MRIFLEAVAAREGEMTRANSGVASWAHRLTPIGCTWSREWPRACRLQSRGMFRHEFAVMLQIAVSFPRSSGFGPTLVSGSIHRATC